MWVENISEVFYGTDGSYEDLENTLISSEGISSALLHTLPNESKATISDSSLCLYFDKDWKLICTSKEAASAPFYLLIQLTDDTSYQFADLAMYESSSSSVPLYFLKLQLHPQASLSGLADS